MNLLEKLNHVVARHDELRQILATQNNMDSQELQRISKEFSDLVDIVEIIKKYREMEIEAQNLAEMIADPGTDNEMKALAEEEFLELKDKIPKIEREIQLKLLPKDEADEKNAILEVRAGTGGDEAALFAANLFRMYQRFAEQKSWKFIPIDINETGIGGYKEASANITGKGVFAQLKFESGVHRVQRVPETESQGRVHTSAATVAVLPEAEEVDIEIDTKDLRIDTYRAQGAGGQHVNKTDSAIRITHLPTNIVVQCQDGKSQHKNRAQAMKMLRSKLYETERKEKDSARASERKNQVGSGDRSERIRTYNYPQGRITDHRINLTLYKLDKVLEGNLDEFINALLTEDQASRLAEIT
ncbi:MAG: peptide chain release factor 1 [Pseudomonadota bacterium]|nr:peptide chain release factor 1 [Pseudomonadota bacterium]